MLRDQPKLPFDQRLVQEALRIQDQVKSTPPGRKRELLLRKARQILPEAVIVPSGVVRLMELQGKGWSYLRP
jgi:hypothetical protein